MNENLEKGEKYLPIGTVVLLQGATKRLMITGLASMSPETGDKIFDYSGCTFPEGFYNYNEVCVFDHDQIEAVFFKGYVDDEQKAFMAEFSEKAKQITSVSDLRFEDNTTQE